MHSQSRDGGVHGFGGSSGSPLLTQKFVVLKSRSHGEMEDILPAHVLAHLLRKGSSFSLRLQYLL
jgi:hypothetical protein